MLTWHRCCQTSIGTLIRNIIHVPWTWCHDHIMLILETPYLQRPSLCRDWFQDLDSARGCLNIKMFYQYMDSHYEDETVSWPSYLHNGNLHSWKDGLYFETWPWMWLWYVTVCELDIFLSETLKCLFIRKEGERWYIMVQFIAYILSNL